MKENRIDKRKIIITIIATLLVLSIIGVVAYAEFTKSSRAKRVVASNDSADAMFSSNYMLKHTGTNLAEVLNKRMLYASSEDSNITTRVTVCNYSQSDISKHYENTITYKLTAKIVTVSLVNGVETMADVTPGTDIGGRTVDLTYTTKDNEGNSQEATKRLSSELTSWEFPNAVLKNDGSHSDICQLVLSKEFNTAEGTKYYLYLTAIPQGTPPPSDIHQLDCVFDTGISTRQQNIDWTGRINERGAQSTLNDPAPTQYDGFRYVVEGNGKGTFKLSWNPTYVGPSEVFLFSRVGAENEVTDDDINISGVLKNKYYSTSDGVTLSVQTETVNGETWNYVQFGVDSDYISRYDLQFYYAVDKWHAFTGWEVPEEPSGEEELIVYLSDYIKYNYTGS